MFRSLTRPLTHWASGSKRKRVQIDRVQPTAEPCEDRKLLTITPSFAGGVLSIAVDNSVVTDPNGTHEVVRLSTDFFANTVNITNSAGTIIGTFGNSGTPVNSVSVTITGSNPNRGAEIDGSPATKPGATPYNLADPLSVVGGPNADFIFGGDAGDNLDGGLGNDTIDGKGGSDTVTGGGGDVDTIITDFGFPGTVDALANLSGGAGTKDKLTFTYPLGVTATIGSGRGFESIIGSPGSDSITVTAVDEVSLISGGVGNDSLVAGNNSATFETQIIGGDGNDTLVGGTGRDILDGGLGIDSMSGNGGDDTLFIDKFDTFSGGLISGGAGYDTIKVDNTNLTPANNPITIANFAATGAEEFIGGDEIDNIDASSATANLILQGGGGDDVLRGGSGNDTIYGGLGNDGLFGGGGNDRIFGDGGNDNVIGEGGNDELYGGAGNDSVDGGAGDDTLNGADFADATNTGTDTLNGGANNDIFIFDMGEAGLIVDYTPPGDRRKNRAGAFY